MVNEFECAAKIMDLVPLIMRLIRSEVRGKADLSMPQFHALSFLNNHPNASLSEVAEHLGLALPTSSKMMDTLVEAALVQRNLSLSDRRFITLALTEKGRAIRETLGEGIKARMAEVLSALSIDEREAVVEAIESLIPLFSRSDEIRRKSKIRRQVISGV